MSKQSEAKERQQYTPKLVPGTCSNCAHKAAKSKLPPWMQAENARAAKPVWDISKYGIDSLSCSIGGFAVKKMGSCAEHAFAGEQATP